MHPPNTKKPNNDELQLKIEMKAQLQSTTNEKTLIKIIKLCIWQGLTPCVEGWPIELIQLVHFKTGSSNKSK